MSKNPEGVDKASYKSSVYVCLTRMSEVCVRGNTVIVEINVEFSVPSNVSREN